MSTAWADKAPPAIISVFIGQQLSVVLDKLENIEGGKMTLGEDLDLKLNVVGKIPDVLLDNTDRNRLHLLPSQEINLSFALQVLPLTVPANDGIKLCNGRQLINLSQM